MKRYARKDNLPSKTICTWLSAFLCFFIASAAQAFSVGTEWNWAHPTSGGNRIESVAYDGTNFVAVGFKGLVRVSSDGFSWTAESYTSSSNLSDHKIIWQGGQFVAVGDGGRITTTVNAVSFFPRTSNTTENLNDISYNETNYIAVGDNSTIVTSSDGFTWVASTGPAAMGSIQGIDWNGSFFVTVSSNGNIFTSPDGANWSQEPTPALLQLHDVVWNGSQWLAVGLPAVVFTSADGVNWVQQSAPPGISNIRSVSWDGSQYLAVGDDGYIVKSTDGIAWSQALHFTNMGQGGGLYNIVSLDVAIASGKYFVVGTAGTILRSLDAGNWNSLHNAAPGSFDRYDAVAYNGSLFMATGKLTDVATSSDGINWVDRSANRYVDVVWDGIKFIAITDDGVVGTTTDGITWNEVAIPAAALISIGISHNGQLVATGFSGQIFTSTDAINWAAQTSGTSNQLTSVANNGSITVVTGVDTLLTSSDLVNWTVQSLPSAGFFPITKVIYANDQFLAVGSQGIVLTSPDGINWLQSSVNTDWWSRGVDWTGNQYIAAGDSGNIMTSLDGLSWQQQRSNTDNDLMDIAGDSSLQVAVGQFGSLLYSQAINEQPEPTADALVTDEDTNGSTTVLANDPDIGDSVSFSVTTDAINGNASIDASGLASYTPNADFNGSDSFVVTATDAAGLSGEVTVSVTVTPVNDRPTANAPDITVDAGSSATSQLTVTDVDTGDTFTYEVTAQASKGTASVSSTGLVSFAANAGTSGSDSMVITVTDSSGGSVDVTISANITAVSTGGSGGATGTSGGGGSLSFAILLLVAFGRKRYPPS